MRSWTLAAVGLLAVAVEGAPRQLLGDELEARDVGLELVGVVGGVVPRSHHDAVVPEGCPTGTVLVSTTTIDVTVYVTATEPAATEPCPDDETTRLTPATTEPCPDETGPVTVLTVATRNPYANLTSTRTAIHTPVAGGGGKEEPCDTETIVSTGSLTVTLATTKPPVSPSATATEPCDDETATTRPTPTKTGLTTHKVIVTTTGLLTTHKTVATAPPHTTTICVIDTAMTPVSKTTLTAKPPTTVAPTKTVYAHDKATGRPSPEAAYCGVRGEPAGTYFIAEFIEDRPGVPVTDEGCYQFCDSVMEDTKGCQAYRFYPNELGAPRCKLYGMPVSYDVRDIDNHQPGMWYDLACGPPSARSVSSEQQQQQQRPQVQEKFVGDKAGGAGADAAAVVDGVRGKEQAKDKAEDKAEGKAEGKNKDNKSQDKAEDKPKGKLEGPRQGAHGSNSTMPGSINRGSTLDTTSPEPDMPLGNDNAIMAQPEMPTGGNGYTSPVAGTPLGGKLPKGGLLGLGLGLGLGPLRR